MEGKTLRLSLMSSEVKAGFPSSADDHVTEQLDLNEHLITHPSATFFVRVDGDSMQGASIQSGDILIVNRALEPQSGHIVVAVLNGEFTVKRLQRTDNTVSLIAENKEYPSIIVSPEDDFSVWGVVTYVVHKCTT